MRFRTSVAVVVALLVRPPGRGNRLRVAPVSHVEGELAPGRAAWDVLQAVFPHGTVSGAPKVRAMEIIDELEPVARGPYAGTVGYLGLSPAGVRARAAFGVLDKEGRVVEGAPLPSPAAGPRPSGGA